ncbi:hypothetical protein GGD66_005948 [Bradyrhizobium sp. CIR48]|uniref:hypothetical protein n=1 Tax=Bradyrhizobium sp. CIR48 TaxID=2663840 RepID=UPI0016056F36|nr:hypothetical protein [Bradyrhizobium sp. CIR48]MBB4427366.1 hypothetical protein [Bradyrhizobium sp. CIR48]
MDRHKINLKKPLKMDATPPQLWFGLRIIAGGARFALGFGLRNSKAHRTEFGHAKWFVSFPVASWVRADYRRLRHIGMGMPAPAVDPILRLGPF